MKSFFIILYVILTWQLANAQFQFVSPRPGSTNLPVSHNIIIRQGNSINAGSIDTMLFSITGSKSGVRAFHLILCDDGKTINLNPLSAFDHEEEVTVSIKSGAFSLSGGEAVSPYSFTFTTNNTFTLEQRLITSDGDQIIMDEEARLWPVVDDAIADPRSIGGIFAININTNPAPGNIFFDCRPIMDKAGTNPVSSINIITNSGDSVYQKMYSANPYDFQMGANGYFDTYRGDLGHYDVLDSNFHIINTYAVTNGFIQDPHELTMLSNGYAFLTAVEDQSGGNSDDQLYRGSIIQEFDPHHNIIFEWRSFDHIDQSEALHANGAASLLDYVHTNSIEVDTDGNIITSNRNIDQINKIDVNTGEFIWRLGGVKNEFTFINDPDKFSCQHDCRRIANGNITLYDDGNYHLPPRSYAKEYHLDEVNKTATLVWSYSHPDVDGAPAFYSAMGSVQRLPNGNTFIDWGQRSKTSLPSITEVDPAGNIVWEMSLAPTQQYIAYRAHKYEWDPCARPSLDSMQSILITNNSARLAWEAVANPSQQYELQYRKVNNSTWMDKKILADNCHLDLVNLDPASQYEWRIQSWCDTVAGTASHFTDTKIFTTSEVDTTGDTDYSLDIYPNPASNEVIINCNCVITDISVFNLLGQHVKAFKLDADSDLNPIQFSVSGFMPGNYFVKVMSDQKSIVKKIMVIK